MAIRNIVKEGDPILNKVCRPVTNFDDRLATLLDDMRETMIAADGEMCIRDRSWPPATRGRSALHWKMPSAAIWRRKNRPFCS